MPTVSANIQGIRYLLDEPSANTPSYRVLFEIFGNQAVHHATQLQNSSAQWSIADWVLTVSTGQEDYLVTAANFGKPFLVYTEDDSDPYRPRIEIPFSMIQNINQFYSGPRQVYSSNDNNPTVQVIAFYRKNGAWYARVAPVPGGTSTYRVWYETAPDTPQSLGDTPGISPFHHLIRVQTAIAALPYCGWGDVRVDAKDKGDRAAWQAKTQALALALGVQAQQFQREFSTYLGTLMQAGVEARDGFADGYAIDTGFGIGAFGPNQL